MQLSQCCQNSYLLVKEEWKVASHQKGLYSLQIMKNILQHNPPADKCDLCFIHAFIWESVLKGQCPSRPGFWGPSVSENFVKGKATERLKEHQIKSWDIKKKYSSVNITVSSTVMTCLLSLSPNKIKNWMGQILPSCVHTAPLDLSERHVTPRIHYLRLITQRTIPRLSHWAKQKGLWSGCRARVH